MGLPIVYLKGSQVQFSKLSGISVPECCFNLTIRPKIKNCVFQVTGPCLFLSPPKVLSLFRGFQRDYSGRHILFPHLPHVKTYNKIKIFPTYRPYFKISCNLKHTYFFLGLSKQCRT